MWRYVVERFVVTRRKHLKSVFGMLRTSRGATAIEYALLAAGVALAITVAVGVLGNTVGALFAFTF